MLKDRTCDCRPCRTRPSSLSPWFSPNPRPYLIACRERGNQRPMSTTRAVALLLCVSSCAYVPRQVRLLAPERRVSPGACVVVEPLTDARDDTSRVGTVRNGLYWPTASVRTGDAPAEWVTAYLRDALSSPEPAAGCCTLEGSLRDLFVDEYVNAEGRLTVSLRLSRSGDVLLERDFTASHSQLSNFASEAELEEALQRTLVALADAALPEIAAAAQACR